MRSCCSSSATGSSRLAAIPTPRRSPCSAWASSGAGELNYSSDIDLILLYDRDAPALAGNEHLSRQFVRGARLLVQLMSETSADGYIFRTDLRLRPDPGSTPLAHVGAGGRALL